MQIMWLLTVMCMAYSRKHHSCLYLNHLVGGGAMQWFSRCGLHFMTTRQRCNSWKLPHNAAAHVSTHWPQYIVNLLTSVGTFPAQVHLWLTFVQDFKCSVLLPKLLLLLLADGSQHIPTMCCLVDRQLVDLTCSRAHLAVCPCFLQFEVEVRVHFRLFLTTESFPPVTVFQRIKTTTMDCTKYPLGSHFRWNEMSVLCLQNPLVNVGICCLIVSTKKTNPLTACLKLIISSWWF